MEEQPPATPSPAAASSSPPTGSSATVPPLDPSAPDFLWLDSSERAQVTQWRDFVSTAYGLDPACARSVVELLNNAIEGHPMDVRSSAWSTTMRQHQSKIPLAGCISRAWQAWKHYLPDRPDIYSDVLQKGWKDPKLDRFFRYDLHQGSPPTGRPSPTDIVMGQELDKLFLLGVTARACDVPEVSGHPTHIMEHGLVPKLDQDGYPSGEYRMILRGRYASSNEDVPTFSGPTDSQFAEFLDLDAQLMRSDGKKMFHQFRARQSQSQLMRFYHPVSGELYCYLAMCMGISGGSRVAQMCTGAICRWMGVNLFIPAFSHCDEFICKRKGRLLSFLQQVVTVAVLVLFGVRLNWEKTDLAVPCQQRIFLGILADTTRLRVSPSPGRLRLLREAARSIREDWLAGKPVSASRLRSLAGSARSCLRLHSTMGFRTIKTTAALRQHAQRHSPSRRDFRRPLQQSAIQWIASELRFLEASHPMEEFRHAHRHRDVPPATFVSDASEWGFAAHGLTDEIQGFNMHLFYQTEDQDHSHNVQEGLGPLLYADALWDQQILPPGRFGYPVHIQALLDNQTAVSAIEKLRTKSLQLAKELIPRVIAWHDQGWVLSARHLIKEIMDTKYSVDQVGRLKSLTRMFRGIPQQLFDQLEHELRNRMTALPPSRWVDVFTSFTIRKSNLYVSDSTESRIPKPLWEDAFHPRFLWNHSRNPQLNPRWGLYLFPPDRLVSAVLDRLTADHSPCCLLVCQFGRHVPMERIEAMQTSPIVFFAMHPDVMIPPESFRHAPTLGGPVCTFLGVTLSAQSSPSAGMDPTSTSSSSRDGTLRPALKAWQPTILDGHVGALSHTARDYIRSTSERILSRNS